MGRTPFSRPRAPGRDAATARWAMRKLIGIAARFEASVDWRADLDEEERQIVSGTEHDTPLRDREDP